MFDIDTIMRDPDKVRIVENLIALSQDQLDKVFVDTSFVGITHAIGDTQMVLTLANVMSNLMKKYDGGMGIPIMLALAVKRGMDSGTK
jgi:hypothetical protein